MSKKEEALVFAEENMARHSGDSDFTEMLKWFCMLQMIRKIEEKEENFRKSA